MTTPALDDAVARAAAALPGVAIDRPALAAALAERAASGEVDAIELALALACARGDAAALAIFERDYLRGLPASLAHMRLDAAVIDDVVQRTRTRLLVAEPGATARVVEYAGRGRLRGLVQVVATRLAVDHTRAKDRPGGGGDELDDLVAVADDPELAFLKATYRAAWREAFTAAVGDLDARARNLLRLHHLGGATLEQLAAMYGVHRATAVRWLADARAGLLRGTRRRLTAALDVSPTELDSILAMIGSRLEASVGRLLADDGDPG
ncbi:MAG: transcriptional regulator [Myxococcales bacterium]|nr:transcriptional regulator [Myxococcales bacterium]